MPESTTLTGDSTLEFISTKSQQSGLDPDSHVHAEHIICHGPPHIKLVFMCIISPYSILHIANTVTHN